MKAVVLALMMVVAGANAAAATPPRDVVIPLTAAVDIGIDGKIQTLEWLNDKPALKVVADTIEPQVRQWEFEPGTVNGAPAPTRSYLTVRVQAKPNDEGSLSLIVKDARTGMRSDKPVVPPYPNAGLSNGINAVVTAIVEFGVDGKGTIQSTDYITSAPRQRYEKPFVEAVAKAIAAWRIAPEHVGGHPVAGTMRIPFVFCVDPTWCEKRTPRAKEDEGDGTTPVALTSATKLRTRVEGLRVGGI